MPFNHNLNSIEICNITFPHIVLFQKWIFIFSWMSRLWSSLCNEWNDFCFIVASLWKKEHSSIGCSIMHMLILNAIACLITTTANSDEQKSHFVKPGCHIARPIICSIAQYTQITYDRTIFSDIYSALNCVCPTTPHAALNIIPHYIQQGWLHCLLQLHSHQP